MKIIQLEQGSPEWLAFRKSHIGASEAPVILGISPYMKPVKLWGQKLGFVPETKSNEWMERGKRLEEDARKLFNEIMGIEFVPSVGVSDEHDWMMASFDGISNDAVVEIKCNGSKSHAVALSGNVPTHHYAQIQHQLYVANMEFGYYYSFDGIDGVTVKVLRDNDYIDDLIAKELAFWYCMTELIPPE